MKVLGISGSPRKGKAVDGLVQEVLSSVDVDTEFISLAGKRISPCMACLRCTGDNKCKVKDDMTELRDKIVEADAYVIGAANYFSILNGLSHCFLERFYQFRHQEGKLIVGKLGVAVGVGGGMPDVPAQNIMKFFEYNQIECVGSVTAQGAASCFICGHGETCKVGAIHMFFGPGTKITDEIIPDLAKQPAKVKEAHALGKNLSKRVREVAAARQKV